MTRPYDQVQYQGHTFDQRTLAALHAAEAKVKDDPDWTVVQGSYNPGGVGQSGGTHDRGGAVDLTPFNWEKRVHALRSVGWAAWHRPAIPGTWGEHIHAIEIGNKKLAPLAELQAKGYLDHRDGLGPWPFGPDNTWHPKPPVVFDWQAYQAERRRLAARAARASAAVKRAVKSLVRARKNTDDKRGKAEIQKLIRELRHNH